MVSSYCRGHYLAIFCNFDFGCRYSVFKTLRYNRFGYGESSDYAAKQLFYLYFTKSVAYGLTPYDASFLFNG